MGQDFRGQKGEGVEWDLAGDHDRDSSQYRGPLGQPGIKKGKTWSYNKSRGPAGGTKTRTTQKHHDHKKASLEKQKCLKDGHSAVKKGLSVGGFGVGGERKGGQYWL